MIMIILQDILVHQLSLYYKLATFKSFESSYCEDYES